MTKWKKLMTAGALSTAALGLVLAGSTFAATPATTATDTKPQITAEQAAKMDTELATKMTTAFDASETAGKITASQKAKLLELDAAVRAKMKDGDHDAAETAIKAMHDWMKSENIDASVMPAPPKDGHGPDGDHGPMSGTPPTDLPTTK